MQTLETRAAYDDPALLMVRKQAIDLEDYYHPIGKGSLRGKRAFRNATMQDVSRLLKGNWLMYDEDLQRVVLAYLRIPEDCSGLVPHLQKIKWEISNRLDGTPSQARTAGFLEPSPLRQRDFCRLSGLAGEDPVTHAAILSYVPRLVKHYQRINPELYQQHCADAESLLPEYHIEDTPFTSAIVNRDNVLPYHYDSGNIKDRWSLMLGLKHDVGEDETGSAGYLVIPEYDLALEIADNTLTAFDGQVALHGVTPFRKLSSRAYRFTIVWYAKAGMWRCLTMEQEVRKAAKLRTEKERNRAAGVHSSTFEKVLAKRKAAKEEASRG